MAKDQAPVILWFRRDLRIADNPALSAAHESGRPIVALYVHDETLEGRAQGAASLWWLDKSLRALQSRLKDRGLRLIVRAGQCEAELRKVVEETGASALYANRLFEPEAAARDRDIVHGLEQDGISCKAWNGSLLCPPGSVLNGSGEPYKVYSPFAKALLRDLELPPERLGPRQMTCAGADLTSESIESLGLHPTTPDWSSGFGDWTPGEEGAREQLLRFLNSGMKNYPERRDIPSDSSGTSRLSAHLHFGEIAPWTLVRRARESAGSNGATSKDAEKFISEVLWREFSWHLLHHFPHLPERNFRPEFDAMPWRDARAALTAWKRGRTGYPVVDAGMRELWATGYMHNRVRMIVASFLIKHLMIDWREGEAWFWDTLVDADLGNNAQNWQWVAGSGADAAPYFRVFNPVTQGEKFDAEGRYVRQWVPELARLSDRWIHKPWEAPREMLADAGVRLGDTYPKPIVDHAEARQRALDAFSALPKSGGTGLERA